MEIKTPKWNIHTHTARCGHAVGEDEEYVLSAIDLGIEYLGFSDHVFIPGRSDPRIRGDYSELEGYIASIRALEQKYAGRVSIKLGFEAEWMDEYADYYSDLLHSKKIDYLIQGQHCRIINDRFFGYGYIKDDNQALELYCQDVIKGMRSGLFTYLCHPDLFVSFLGKWNEKCEEITHRICKAAFETKTPLEFNLGASRSGRNNLPWATIHYVYPFPKFWIIAKTYGIPVVLGIDAHSPRDFQDSNYAWAYSFIQGLNLDYVDSIPLRTID